MAHGGGDGWALAGIAVVASGVIWRDRAGVLALGGDFGRAGAAYAVKFVVGRPRPPLLEGATALLSASYPSAHTAGAVATLGFLGFLAGFGRGWVVVATVVAVVAIGGSRLVLGVHFATDVAGGALLGGVWLLLGMAAVAPAERAAAAGISP